MSQPFGEPDFLPTAALPVLRLRSEMLNWVRQFFRSKGFWEVETPLLSQDVCVDAWLEPFFVESGGSRFYLQTSPEFGMKRLLAAGAESIFQITRAFRQEETGRLHNPEFTMLEWYRVGDTYHQQMDFVEKLTHGFCHHAEVLARKIDGMEAVDFKPAFLNGVQTSKAFCRTTYDDAFQQVFGDGVLSKSVADLRALATKHGVEGPSSLVEDDRDGWLNLLLSEVVEPMLAKRETVFLYDYPASQAALSRIRSSDPPVAERFELYFHGVEICNGYQELTDSHELRRRQTEQSRKRQQAGLSQLPEHSRLLAAMDLGIPESSGVALGFDRLLLAALRMSSLSEVTAFPIGRA
ncbi:MAG: EF-P lysine aminoacylase GenX [Planctomycetaceae bacterium]|nr:EF-P lysine aminoacylase GenX [Planctomycetaceae bacterium]